MIDYEPYFELWEACVPLGSLDQKHLVGIPCYKHKTCGHLTTMQQDKKPPVVCTWCFKNTEEEIKTIKKLEEANGAKVLFENGIAVVPQFPYRRQG